MSKMESQSQEIVLDWKRPDQLLKLQKFRLRKFALQARFKRSSNNETKTSSSQPLPSTAASSTSSKDSNSVSKKRKNPFLRNDKNKKAKASPSEVSNESGDSTFELLKLQNNSLKIDELYQPNGLLSDSIIRDIEVVQVEEPKGTKHFPINWSLHSRLRIMSPKPFPWKGKLKASEEASGTTAFVRRLDISEQETTLDTSPNARFHQCCLVWQHPSIPWIELFPRSQSKMNLATTNVVPMNQSMKDALYQDWCNSFRSLFHLLRVRQCPYFYVCGNNFTVLFRAAGICGISEVQALLTPSTRGLRESLKNDDIKFTMPLKSKEKHRTIFELNGIENELNNDDEEHGDEWLKDAGIEESEIRRLSFVQTKVQTGRECDGDNLHESLVFVQGVEAQALFNFLINCKTIMTACGPYTGIPPTLLSPISFHGATLKPLKVRESVVANGPERFHSLEITGPILPDVLPSLCLLMTSDHLEKFSVSSAQLKNTVAFTLAKHGIEPDDSKTEIVPPSAFGLENLTDCGFSKEILSHFCSSDPERIENFESLSCTNKLYTWT